MVPNTMLQKAFGLELKKRRTERNQSQEEFADSAKVNRTFIAKLELGKNQPSLTTMFCIADALKVDLDCLIKATMDRYKRECESSPRGKAKEALPYMTQISASLSPEVLKYLPWSGSVVLYPSIYPSGNYALRHYSIDKVHFSALGSDIPVLREEGINNEAS